METVRKVFADPPFANTPEYSLAFNELESDKFTTDPISGGTVRTKGLDLIGMGFPEPGSYGRSTSQATSQNNPSLAGTTYTKQQMIQNGSVGTNKKTGKNVYVSGYDANGKPTYVEF